MNLLLVSFITIAALAAIILPALVMLFFVVKLAHHSRRIKQRAASESMIGMTGRAASALSQATAQGVVLVRGELWHALSTSPIAEGAPVRVIGFSQLALVVEAA